MALNQFNFPHSQEPLARVEEFEAEFKKWLGNLERWSQSPVVFKVQSPYDSGTFVEFLPDGTIQKSVSGVTSPL